MAAAGDSCAAGSGGEDGDEITPDGGILTSIWCWVLKFLRSSKDTLFEAFDSYSRPTGRANAVCTNGFLGLFSYRFAIDSSGHGQA